MKPAPCADAIRNDQSVSSPSPTCRSRRSSQLTLTTAGAECNDYERSDCGTVGSGQHGRDPLALGVQRGAPRVRGEVLGEGLAEAGRERAKQFSWARTAEATIASYERALA